VKTGVQGTYNWWKELDSGFRRNDGKTHFLTFYEIVNIGKLIFPFIIPLFHFFPLFLFFSLYY